MSLRHLLRRNVPTLQREQAHDSGRPSAAR